jgi:hypothetical protein
MVSELFGLAKWKRVLEELVEVLRAQKPFGSVLEKSLVPFLQLLSIN